MTKETTFRSWALAVLAVLALGACNRDWDTGRAIPFGAGAGASTPARAPDAMGIGMAPGAAGQGLQAGAVGARTSFAALPDRGDLVGYPRDRVVRREGAYTWHRADVSEEHALRAIFDGELRITAPDGQLLAFEYERHVEHPTGDWTWIGRLRDAPPGRQAILTFGANAVFGSIAQTVSEPLRLAMRDGASWLVQADPALLAGVEERVLRPESPDFLLPPMYFGNPAVSKTSGETDTVSSPGVSVESSSSTTSSITTVVDVLVGYTPGFATYHGGDSQARTRINFLVEVANQGYVNSQIDARVRLVHAMPVNYPDSTDNGDTLEKMSGYKSGTGKTIPDPAFSALRDARETYGADLVTLIRKFNTPENDGCGIAWLIGGGLTTITQGYEYFGYSVVGDGIDQGDDGKNYFCRDETMVHEFGHNMGSAHDIETAKGDDGVLQTKEYGAYTYSFGYRTGPGAGDFYTIMAYREKRESGTQQQPYRVFSNPNITFCGTYPCGTSSADNARSLRQTMPVISGFRSTVVPVIGKVPDDINGDGKSDIIWRQMAQNQVAYWMMDGAVVSSYGFASGQAGYRIISTGDFNGDNRIDMLWDNGGTLYLWASTGTGFSSQYVASYGDGWKPVTVSDVDGDGKVDIIWVNPQQGQLAYWLMNGATVIGYGFQAALSGYNIIGAGDFNGDSKFDLLWDNGGTLYLWTSTTSGFSSALVASYGDGWKPEAVADVNGDGKMDIIWRQLAQNQIAYWIMSGAVVTGYGFQAGLAGYSIIGTGDFNGDGRYDLLWDNGGTLYSWLSTGSGFTSALVASYGDGWTPWSNALQR